tara:strand:- start:2362 stop:2910 length:549 start_codon:yes stop_codon:yes gene_type:complete
MWFNILKRLKTKGKSSLTGFKIEDVNEERPDVEEDNCNRQLKEYADKIKNTYISSKFTPSPHKLGIYRVDNNDFVNARIIMIRYVKKIWDRTQATIWVYHKYNVVPENVACEALKILKDNKDVSIKMNNNRYRVRLFINEKDNSRAYKLVIYDSGRIFVELGLTINKEESYPDISNIDIDWR